MLRIRAYSCRGGVMVEFVPLTVVVVVPTIVAFIYFLTRTYLGVWGKLMVFAIRFSRRFRWVQ